MLCSLWKMRRSEDFTVSGPNRFYSILILIAKQSMRSCGITGAVLDWFMDYLFNRSMICKSDGQRSEPRSLTCGVPQGSILGPILCLSYFNDLAKSTYIIQKLSTLRTILLFIYLSRKRHKWRITKDG